MGTKRHEPDAFSFYPFEGLKKMIEGRRPALPGRPSTHKLPARKESEQLSDEEFFAREMSGVKEIREYRSMRIGMKKPALPCKKTDPEKEALNALREIVTGRGAVNLADTQEYVEWINKDFSAEIVRLLHEGRFSVSDCLDLHGLSVDESEEEVEAFFRESMRRRYKCVKIIHGRGLRSPRGPVLKETLVRRLSGKYRKHLIAFVTARQCDGGLGALYILLK